MCGVAGGSGTAVASSSPWCPVFGASSDPSVDASQHEIALVVQALWHSDAIGEDDEASGCTKDSKVGLRGSS